MTRLEVLPREWDVVVVGAGVAGGMAAQRMAGHGLEVLLVEKAAWPRDKACGGCVNAAALGMLDEAGLTEFACAGRGYASMRLARGSRRALMPLPPGRAISRRHMDALLVERAVAAGARFLSGTQAILGAVEGDRRTLRLHHAGERSTITAKLVLCCDGLGSRLLREEAPDALEVDDTSPIGLGATIDDASPFYASGIIHMACGAHGYVGLVRVEAGRLNIGAALDPGWMKRWRTPALAIAAVLNEAAFPIIDALHEADWQGTPRLTRRRRCLGGERVLVLGDSAGYVEPFTGEGMGWAIAAAMAIEPLALAAVDQWQDTCVERWTARHAALLQARQRRCRRIAQLLRRPRLVATLLPLIDALPGAVAPLTDWLNRDYRLSRLEEA